MPASSAKPRTSSQAAHPSLAERFWSLAEAAERKAAVERSYPVGVIRQVLAIFRALDAGRSGGVLAASTRAFLAELAGREQAGDLRYSPPERATGEATSEL